MKIHTSLKVQSISLLLFLSLISLHTAAQAPAWKWSHSAGTGGAGDYGTMLATDAAGNVYATGMFSGHTITFGSTTLTNASAPNSVSYDVFTMKYDAAGNLLWIKQMGSGSDDKAQAIAVDASGNVFVTGSYAGTCVVGSTTLTSNMHSEDIFLIKYDSSGNLLWVKSAGGQGSDISMSLGTDASGNVYMAGGFDSSTLTFGSTSLTKSPGTSISQDVFLVKYDASGTVLWAKRAGGSDWDRATAVSVDASGNAVISGDFSSTAITFGSATLTRTGNQQGLFPDVYMAKYDASGTVLWAKNEGGNGQDGYFYNSSTVDASGNVYLTADYQSSITLGSSTFTHSYTAGFFITKHDASGNLQWAKSPSDSYTATPSCIKADHDGNILLAGYFNGADTLKLDTAHLYMPGYNAFIAKYTPSGSVLWIKGIEGPGLIVSRSMGFNPAGETYVVGDFYSTTMHLDTTTVVNSGTTNYNDFFIAKLASDATPVVVGIGSKKKEAGLSVHPNPFSSVASIQSPVFLNEASLTLVNASGQVVMQMENVSGSEITLHRKDLPEGLYFLRLLQKGQIIETKKLVIIN